MGKRMVLLYMGKLNGTIIELHEVKKMEQTVKIKPIRPCVEVTEERYVKEILSSLQKKPSANSIKRNEECLNLLRKARRG
jgi:hypothetical protein